MTYKAIILADSISRGNVRLTSMEVTFPRIILAEFNTHRMFSRNSASSRAIPVATLLDRVRLTPFVPERFGKNQAGMQAGDWLTGEPEERAHRAWIFARNAAIAQATVMHEAGVHKQTVNRLLEPFLWHTVIVSATEWSNFFALRCHPDAQPEIQRVAILMREAMAASTPRLVEFGDWHRPLMPDLEELAKTYPSGDLNKIAVGRCARVSYDRHHEDGDPDGDIRRADKLLAAGHLSPSEHVATPDTYATLFTGNFRGWVQARKLIAGESDFGRRDDE